jgi:uncharacterized membrane protein YdjX (TVP38/TMEM64 family)
MSRRTRWGIIIGVVGLLIAGCVWLVVTNAPIYQLIVRLYVDKIYLKQKLREWGVLAPVIFIALQSLQVILSPIPGEATGILGGYLFGQWLGLLYSTIGLTLGSIGAFAIGRWLGAHYVKNLVSPETWKRLGFIVEAEGAVLCFIVYLIPGLPKDIVCYLFGISPMPPCLAGLGARAHPRHLGPLGPGGAYRGGGLHARHPRHRGGGGGRSAAVLLPAPDHDLVPRAQRPRGVQPGA